MKDKKNNNKEEPKIYQIKSLGTNRRDFISRSLLGAGAISSLGILSGCEKPESRYEIIQEMSFEDVSFRAFCFNSDGSVLASVGYRGMLILWSIPDGELINKFDFVPISGVTDMIFSPDDKLLYIGDSDTYIYILNVSDGSVVNTIFHGRRGNDAIQKLEINDSNTILISGTSNGGPIKLWQLPEGTLLKSLPADGINRLSLSLNRENDVLASGNGYNTQLIKFWSIPEGELIDTLSEIGGYNPRYSPVNNTLVTMDWGNGYVYVTDLDSKKQLFSEKVFESSVYCIDYSPNGELIAALGQDADIVKIKIWNTKNFKLVASINLDSYCTGLKILFHPDGEIIATNYSDHITLWAVNSGKKIETPGAECQCNSVCTCDTVMSDQSGGVCTCHSVEKCTCNEVCSCNKVCTCDSHTDSGGGSTSYWYPN